MSKRWIFVKKGGVAKVEAGLYAAGAFTSIDGVTYNYLARWDGSSWNPVGGNSINGSVTGIGYYKDELYVAGEFTSIEGENFDYIAKWNGKKWSNVGSGFSSPVSRRGTIIVGSIHGGEEKLYVKTCHSFSSCGVTNSGVTFTYGVASWDGNTWARVGSSGNASTNGETFGFVTDPSGNMTIGVGYGNRGALKYLDSSGAWVQHGSDGNPGGRAKDISLLGGNYYVGSSNLFRWNGTSWSNLGGGNSIHDTAVFNGSVYVTGRFMNPSGSGASVINRYDGTSWFRVNPPLTGDFALFGATYGDWNDGGGNALFLSTSDVSTNAETETSASSYSIRKLNTAGSWSNVAPSMNGIVMHFTGVS
jgi:hypothetical protein